jgi:two-component system, OmpR family, response regulator
MEHKPCRIAVIEDSSEYLAAIESALATMPETVLVGIANTAADGIQMIERAHPDLLLVDVFLRQGTGIEVLQHCQSQLQPMAIAVMTNAPSPELERYCRKLGATGFHDKADGFDWVAGMAARHQ